MFDFENDRLIGAVFERGNLPRAIRGKNTADQQEVNFRQAVYHYVLIGNRDLRLQMQYQTPKLLNIIYI